MTRCNYIALNTDRLDPLSPYLDELFDLDILCTEEGIFINVAEDAPARHGRRA
jgi:hypothetical protein